MDLKSFEKYNLTKAQEEALWQNCFFVFDSSALLDFYFYPDETRENIYADIFEKIKNRLWIPSHVQFEYLKNRETIIRKPINENYKPLTETIIKPIGDSIIQTQKRVEELKQKIKNRDKHPHLDQEDIKIFEGFLSDYQKAFAEFEKNFRAKIDERLNEIIQLENNDTILETFASYFKVGRDYSFEEILDLTKEGKHRYEFDIPPGFEDLKKERKEGTQIFGDLIIWKQILEFAKENNTDIVFVCNDLKKDWCLVEDGGEKRIKKPREELIKEFSDHTGRTFWMYNQAQFIYSSNKLLNSDIDKEKIEQISNFISQKHIGNYLEYKCHECGKVSKLDIDYLDLDYQNVDGSERQMGPENHYEANETFECPRCDYKIDASFNIWEYPIGVINYTSVELGGAEVIKEPVLYIDLDDVV